VTRRAERDDRGAVGPSGEAAGWVWVPTWQSPACVLDGVIVEATWDRLVAEHGEPDAQPVDLAPFVGALADLLIADLLARPHVA